MKRSILYIIKNQDEKYESKKYYKSFQIVFAGTCLRRIHLRMSHAARPQKRRPRMTPPAMAPLRAALPLFELPGVDAGVGVLVVFVLVVFDGLRPCGQKSPPLGGSTHVRESPSTISTKFDEIDIDDVVLVSIMNSAGLGTVSTVEQLGPRAPINDLLPKKLFLCTVKLTAEVMAIP
jgi:hypothetical protein